MIGEAGPVGRGAGQPPQVVVDNGKIKIGDRVFRVKYGDVRVNDPVVLAKVQQMLTKGMQGNSLQNALQTASVDVQEGGRLRITIASGGVSVHKGESAQTIQTSEKFSAKFERVEGIIQSQASFQEKIESALSKGKYTKADFAAAAKNLFQEQGIDYLHYAKEQMPTDAVIEDPLAGNKVLAHLLQLPGNEGVFAGLKELAQGEPTKASGESKKAKECEKELRFFLLQCLKRNPQQAKIGLAGTYTQYMVMGHADLTSLSANTPTRIDANTIAKPNCALTSAQDGGKMASEIKNHNVNLGAVEHANRRGETQCVVTRSGKSHTLERLKEAVLNAACNQLYTDHPKGFVQNRDGSYEFQHAITSFMDFSREKAIGSPGNERAFLKEMLAAVDAWPPEGYKIVMKDSDGQDCVVILKKPIIRQQLFSCTVKGVNAVYDKLSDLGQTESDSNNFVSTGVSLNAYLQSLQERPPGIVDASKKLNEKLQKLSGDSEKNFLGEDGLIKFHEVSQLLLVENPSLLKSKAYEAYAKEVATFLLTQVKDSNDTKALALYSIMFRKALPAGGAEEVLRNISTFQVRPKPEEQLHPADLEIFSNIIYDKLNISCGKQCKSGKDRTAIGVALKSAQAAFREKHGYDFIPGQMRQDETITFKAFFRKNIKELCAETTLESHGYMGFKWDGAGGNPVAYKYLYNEGDIVHLERHPELDPDFKKGQPPDVLGLTQKGIDGLGKGQFAGKLRNNAAVYGKSASSPLKELEKAEKSTAGQRREAKKALETFFEGLGIDEEILNNSLQLSVHSSQLPIKKESDNYNRLEAEIRRLNASNEGERIVLRMQLYALTTIKNIIDERAAIKAMALPERVVSFANLAQKPDFLEGFILEEI